MRQKKGVPPSLQDRLMTRDQAQEYLACSESHLKELIRTGELRTMTYLKQSLVVKASADEYLSQIAEAI